MAKFVNDTHILGEEGVNAFATYCNKHKPYIIWREETKNDFGIDGEIELTKMNENGKIEATGEIIKIQLKSTTGGYIGKDTENEFNFIAKKEDVEYWSKHKCQVVLIVYFPKGEKLFAKKIENLDLASSKKSLPIKFSKSLNILETYESDFVLKFSKDFKERVDFSKNELLLSNIFKVHLPKFIHSYPSNLRKQSDLKDKIGYNEQPDFVLKDKLIYLFNKMELFQNFYTLAIATETDIKPKQIYLKEFIKDTTNKRTLIELINKTFRNFCFSRYVGFNKDFNRYYFKIDKDSVIRQETYVPVSGKRSKATRAVVQYYEYGNLNFFKHFAFETSFFFSDLELFVAINPKYLFTKDRNHVIDDPADITKLTNFLTARERNEQYMNHVHFIFSFFAKNNANITIASYQTETISLSKNLSFTVPFGIPIDNRRSIIENTTTENPLPTLF